MTKMAWDKELIAAAQAAVVHMRRTGGSEEMISILSAAAERANRMLAETRASSSIELSIDGVLTEVSLRLSWEDTTQAYPYMDAAMREGAFHIVGGYPEVADIVTTLVDYYPPEVLKAILCSPLRDRALDIVGNLISNGRWGQLLQAQLADEVIAHVQEAE